MHLKKTKKTPRMIRMIALMLSLVLVFFTMTGMALAEEGTDAPDAAPDSTLEIVEAELEAEPEPTEEPPAETPGVEETPEPTPEPEEPSVPPEPTDTPTLKSEYALDAEIPLDWHNTPVTITVRLIDKNETGWVKIEAAFSGEDDAEHFDVTEEWNEYGYLERFILLPSRRARPRRPNTIPKIRYFLQWKSPVQKKCPKMPSARGLGRLPPAPPFWKSWWLPALWSAKRAKRR